MKKENRNVARLDIILALILLILAAVILWEQGVFDPLLNKLPSLKKNADVTETAETFEEDIYEETYPADPDEAFEEGSEDLPGEEPDSAADVSPENSEETASEVSGEASEGTSEQTSEQTSAEISDETSEEASEETSSEAASGEPSDESTEGASAPYYEPSGGSYDQILVNVLSALLSDDYNTLAEYVSADGLRLCPMGAPLSTDVILSKEAAAAFPDRDSTLFGYRRGSGNAIYMTGSEYCRTFICPENFDFSAASVYYDAGDDLSLAENIADGTVHTVRYTYEQSIMEWQDIVLVFVTEGEQDKLAAIMHRDATTH